MPWSCGRTLRFSSRETVEGARPSRRAISRTPWPRSRSVAIRCRSSSDKKRDDRESSATRAGECRPARPATGIRSCGRSPPGGTPQPSRHRPGRASSTRPQAPAAAYVPSPQLHTPSHTRSVATSTGTRPSPGGQFSRVTDSHLTRRSVHGERGNRPEVPVFVRLSRSEGIGLARRRPTAAGWGGGLVVVAGVTTCRGGRESRLQGEGIQRAHAREVLQGMETLVNTGEPWPAPFWAEGRATADADQAAPMGGRGARPKVR